VLGQIDGSDASVPLTVVHLCHQSQPRRRCGHLLLAHLINIADKAGAGVL
jgi:hypothetical protein